MLIQKMLCETLENPIGIDCKNPQLGWIFSAKLTEKGKTQTAYRVLVASSEKILSENKGDLWDSGKVGTDQSNFIKYQGKELQSRQQCFWKVKFWDEKEIESGWSQIATWSMGVFPQDWKGDWIGERIHVSYEDRFPVSMELEECPPFMRAAARKLHPHGTGPENDYAQAIYLRKEFKTKLTIKNAIVRIAGIGYYELYLNGEKIGDHVLDPGATDYTKSVLYASYDITAKFTTTENCFGVILGNGWYWVGTPDLFGFDKALWAAPPKCRLELELLYTDGSKEFVGSDNTWMCTNQGPIKFNSIRSGEIYDARMELGNWAQKGGVKENDAKWKPSTIVPSPKGILRSHLSPAIKIMDTFGPCNRMIMNNGSIVFWFPKNNAGWVTLKIKGDTGQLIKIEMNELLNPDGTVDMDIHSGHTYGTYQTLEYICKGTEIETYHPRFCYGGFQYVQITGAKPDQIIEIMANQVCTSFEAAGQFNCSNLLINAINSASKSTFLNGFHSYPEDCPQREKAGWTEDACLSAHGSIYNFNTLWAYKKWIQDLMDAQHEPSGQVPDIVPTPFWGKPSKVTDTPLLGQWTEEYVGKMADPWWGGVLVLLPWRLYEHYGDPTLLETTYPAMKKYVDFLLKTTEIAPNDFTYIINWTTLLGEWLEVGSNGSANRTPRQLTTTQAFYYYATILTKIAHRLNKSDDEKRYEALSHKIFDAFNEEYLNRTEGFYCKDSQSADAMSLALGLTPKEMESKVVEHLKYNIIATHQGHLSTGIVGTYYLYNALCQYKHPELAYQVITAKGFPGFEHNLTRVSNKTPIPSTTLWEDWGGVSSLAHPVQGTVVSFFYEWLAGIQSDVNTPGFKKFKIAPQIVGDLLWVKAQLPTAYGTIVSNWTLKDKNLSLDVEIPVNTSAEIHFTTKDSGKIQMGSERIQTGNGIERIIIQHDNVIAICGSGRYQFQLNLV